MLKKLKNCLRLFSCLVLFSWSTASLAQVTRETGFWDNVRYGGNINIGFGNDLFSAGIAPSILYDFNAVFSAGLGPSLTYTTADNFELLAVATREFVFIRPLEILRLSVEAEQYFVHFEREFNNTRITEDYTYPALFLGLGYTTGPLTAGLRYDVLYDDEQSIYGSALLPFISVYF